MSDFKQKLIRAKQRMHNQGIALRVARLNMGLSQKELIQSLGYPLLQPAISKIERGEYGADGVLWQELIEFYKFDPNIATETGYIETGSKPQTKLKELSKVGSFKIPDRYRMLQGSTVRTALPLLLKGWDALGIKMDDWLRMKGFSKTSYFRVLNNPINLNFIHDLLEFLVISKVISNNFDTSQQTLNPVSHGSMMTRYLKMDTSIQIIKKVLANADFYQGNHNYQIQDIGPGFIEFSIDECEHLKEFKASSELLEFAHMYRVNYFKSFAEMHRKGISLNVEGNHKQCLIRISA